MSSITMFARGELGVLVTDTAGTDPAFVFGARANKVATVPHHRLAMTAQGSAEALSTFADRLTCALGGLDAIVREGSDVLAEEYDLHMMRWSDEAACPEFKLGIVGWSDERKRFEAHFIQSNEYHVKGAGEPPVAPFTFVRRDLVMAPLMHPDDLQTLGIPKDGAAFASNAEAFLLRILGLQRHVASPRPGSDGAGAGYLIGGEAIATILTPDGITQRVVHRWADKLGEPIRPAPLRAELAAISSGRSSLPAAATSAAAPPAIAGMSSQQRRAADAEARKAQRASV